MTDLLSSAKPKHRSFAGDPDDFDLASGASFSLLTALGLREFHSVLEMGCGALGLARLLIPYLLAGRYFGVEHEQWLLEEGIRMELGHDQLDMKKPRFLVRPTYSGSEFGVKFDYAVMSLAGPEIRTSLEESAKCLRHNGVLIVSSDDPDNMLAIATAVGLEGKMIDWPHPTGITWILFWLPGSDAPIDSLNRFQANSITELSELQVVPNVNCGFVDSIVENGNFATVSGWAIHPETGRAATHVLVANSMGRIVAKTRVGILRSDVAAVHGQQALRSGFRFQITRSAVDDPRSAFYVGLTAGERKAFALRMK